VIVNSKSGPKHDSLLRVQELVRNPARSTSTASVRVKLRKKQARGESRRSAARGGCQLVMRPAATVLWKPSPRGWLVPAPCSALFRSHLQQPGDLPGHPRDVREACALIATATPRAIDTGQLTVQGEKPRLFFETCAIGIGAAMTSAGQAAEKSRWAVAAQTVPAALAMPPVITQIRLDGRPPQWSHTLLVTVSNAPRAGAGLRAGAAGAHGTTGYSMSPFSMISITRVSPHDYRYLRVPASAMPTIRTFRRARCVAIRIRAARPLPVAADSKLIGTTPGAHRGAAWRGADAGRPRPRPGTAPSSSLRELAAEVAPAAESSRQR